MSISAILKSRGHACDVLIETFEKEDLIRKAVGLSPDFIAFSCLASDFPWAVGVAAEIKKHRNIPSIFGGTHVTLNPEESLAPSAVDMICIGEGEQAMVELAEALSAGVDFSGILNLWVKRDGRVIRNKMRDLVADLDSLPFPDRKLYDKYPFFRERGKRPIHFGRGCPYDCTYCHNASKKRLFLGKGRFVRWRSQENILAEIGELVEGSYIKVLHVIDDSFGVNREWLKEFLPKLAASTKTRLAVQANMRADIVTEDLCRAFQEYGNRHLRLRIAVETGNEEYRKKILKKNITNEALFKAAGLFRKNKIRFITYNMIGLPGETLPLALETLRLNMKLKPALAIGFIFQPYLGTELASYALEKGFLSAETARRLGTREFSGFYHSRSPLHQKDIRKIENLHKVFSLVAKRPFLYPFFRWMIPLRVFSLPLLIVYRTHVRFLLWRRFAQDRY
jgi:anaerobic magnesium-protoporphyrin IX monomethyl ester cyclase